MKKRLALAALILTQSLVGAATEPQADLGTVHGLYQACSGGVLVQKGYCYGFLDGVGAMMHASTAAAEKQGIHANSDWCEPDNTTRDQLLQAFKRYHDEHQEQWQRGAAPAVVAALQAAWPCAVSNVVSPAAEPH